MEIYPIENGRYAGLSGLSDSDDLAMSKLVSEITASNMWTATEYNSNNAWNVNFGSGNFNNNNKYNSNVVRAVAALSNSEIESFEEALIDCRRHKNTSKECLRYCDDADIDLATLAAEVFNGIYHPTTSICFVVTHPKLREIFAAHFRDRIVQHWIILRLNDLIEARFRSQGNVSYNCRKGFGTLLAQKDLQRRMEQFGYDNNTYVGHFDIKSFFMSIDVELLWTYLEPFIRENYRGHRLPSGVVLDDEEVLLRVTKLVIFHRPQSDCEKRGDLSLFDKMEPGKSMLEKTDMTGMPIGNITSQILANFFMSFFDEWILIRLHQLGFGALPWEADAFSEERVELASDHYIRFVDDFSLVGLPKHIIVQLYKESMVWLRENLHLTLHSDKVYIQQASHCVKFVGAVVKPGRIYIINRTKNHLAGSIRRMDRLSNELSRRCRKYGSRKSVVPVRPGMYRLLDELERGMASVNSLLGIMRHLNTYSIRREMLSTYKRGVRVKHPMYAVCFSRNGYTSIAIRPMFTINNYFKIIARNEETVFNDSSRRAVGRKRKACHHAQVFYHSDIAANQRRARLRRRSSARV